MVDRTLSGRVSIAIPRETVNDETVRILGWKFASGSAVRKDDLICEAETSKAVMEIHAPESGTLIYSVSAGDDVPVGATICEIVPEGIAVVPGPKASMEAQSDRLVNPDRRRPARLTPLAVKVAAEFGVGVSDFEPGTVVRQKDVLRKLGKLPQEPPAPLEAQAARPAPDREPMLSAEVDWTELPRRKVFEGGILAAGRTNSVSSFVSAICRARGLRARAAGLDYPPVGLYALIVFEVARLLRRYPVFNSVYHSQRIGRYREVNVGWAIDEGGKLVVPVIRQADLKTLDEIGSTMQEQLQAYVGGSLAPADFAGATFTVTDLSGEGIGVFQPLISQGQSAILGIGSDSSRSDEVFFLTLAFDHQLSEGRAAARFLAELRERLEAHSLVASESSSDGETRPAEPFCLLCQRDLRQLSEIKAILLKSEIPPGLVCSLCVGGWL